MHNTVAHCFIYLGFLIQTPTRVYAWYSGEKLQQELSPLTITFIERDSTGELVRRYTYTIFKHKEETRPCQDALETNVAEDKAAFIQRIKRWGCCSAVSLVVYILLPSVLCQLWPAKQAVITSIRVAKGICWQIPLCRMKSDMLDLSNYMMNSQAHGGVTCTCTSKLLLLLAAKVVAHILFHTLVPTYQSK